MGPAVTGVKCKKSIVFVKINIIIRTHVQKCQSLMVPGKDYIIRACALCGVKALLYFEELLLLAHT